MASYIGQQRQRTSLLRSNKWSFFRTQVFVLSIPFSRKNRQFGEFEHVALAWHAGGEKSVTDIRLFVNLREMDFRKTERNFTRPTYTCLKCLHVVRSVFTV